MAHLTALDCYSGMELGEYEQYFFWVVTTATTTSETKKTSNKNAF